MYNIFEKLCELNNVTPYRVCKETGITTATISNWKAGRYIPKQDKMKKIADYFKVTVDYLMTGEESAIIEESTLNLKYGRDIANDLRAIIGDINSTVETPLYYDGKKVDKKSLTMLVLNIENTMKQMEIMQEKDKK
ncbi:MAG: helix-turn-helix transcriptional regulator [Hungatella sp.]|nr:helix-turn-helix transcriptional regulator [Hungatella sp.]